MFITTLSAHFDGERICLDEQFDLEPGTKLMVTILPKQESDYSFETFLDRSQQRQADQCHETKPEYIPHFLEEVNLTMNVLPDAAKNELISFYQFLIAKYQLNPDFQINEKHAVLSGIFKEANGILPSNYNFNREELHER